MLLTKILYFFTFVPVNENSGIPVGKFFFTYLFVAAAEASAAERRKILQHCFWILLFWVYNWLQKVLLQYNILWSFCRRCRRSGCLLVGPWTRFPSPSPPHSTLRWGEIIISCGKNSLLMLSGSRNLPHFGSGYESYHIVHYWYGINLKRIVKNISSKKTIYSC